VAWSRAPDDDALALRIRRVSSAQWSTHDHDDYSNKDRFASSQVLSEDTGGNAATKSTDFEDGYNQSFDIPASR
jgi:hypothetical protein